MQRLALLTCLIFVFVVGVLATVHQASAQSGPGAPSITAPRPAAAQGAVPQQATRGVLDGAWYWVLERQRELTQAMTNAVRRLQGASFWSAAAQLGLISFLYGVFHAAGPGHGKFVISSYALANAETLRRGITVSFMAAFLQAVSAIVLVGVLAVVVKATSLEIRRAEAWLESLSWGLIALLGAWLLWGRLNALLVSRTAAPVAVAPAPPRQGAAAAHAHQHAHDDCCGHDHDHGHHHGHHHHAHHHHAHHGHAHHGAPAPSHQHTHHHATHHQHAHAHDHVHAPGESCEACGHAHAPAPSDLQGTWSWRQAWSIALAVGVRPCTGAIAVLLFSLGIGLFAAGVFATFAMAVGTALTVSFLATLAVTSRDLAKRLSAADSPWAGRIQSAAGIAGSFLVFALGASFFVASLTTSGPL